MDMLEVIGDDKIRKFPMCKSLPMETVRSYYSNAIGLDYDSNDARVSVVISNDIAQLMPGVNKYYVVRKPAVSRESKLSKYASKKRDQIMRIVDGNVSSDDEIDESPVSKSTVVVGPSTRSLFVGWKHRFSTESKFQQMKGILGGVRETHLEINRKYNLEDLKSVCVEAMKDENNERYFGDVDIQLGNFKEEIFSEFRNEAGEKCDFWKWCKTIKSSNRQMKIYLLTTKNNRMDFDEKSEQMKNADGARQEVTDVLKDVTNNQQDNSSKQSLPSIFSKTFSYPKIDFKCPSNYKSSNQTNEALDLTKSSQSFQSITLINVVSSKMKSQNCISNTVISNQPSNKRIKFSSEKIDLKQQLLNLHLGVPLIEFEDFHCSSIPIGKGAYGTVFKGTWLSTEVAIKKIRQKEDNKYIIREIQVLEKIRHPHVISIMGVSVYYQEVYILMELFESETLRNVLFKVATKSAYGLDMKKKISICIQLCQAVSFLHNRNVIHRDIKPENILVNQFQQLKICDMGFSKYDSMPTELCSTVGNAHGTLLYMAPEQILHQETSSIKSDVWALACVIVEIFSEDFVWDVHFGFDMREQLVRFMTDRRKPKLEKLPKELRKVLSACFDVNPLKRPQASTLLDLFKFTLDKDSDSE